MEFPDVDINKTLLPWMGRTMKEIDYYITNFWSENGIKITKTQWLLLVRLHFSDGSSQHDLAFITGRDKASLTRLVSTMEKKNLVARIPSKTDKRINNIFLTKQGQEIVNKILPLMKVLFDNIQEGVTEQEVETLIRIMKKINSNINSNALDILLKI